MNLNMFVQIGTLGEAVIAIWEITCIGPFVCVNAKVVKEIVPLPEPFLATHLIALQDLDEPFGLRVFVWEDTVGIGVWDMLFNLDGVKIECLSWLNSHDHVRIYFIESLAYSS